MPKISCVLVCCVLLQQWRAGEADEDRVLQPALHLLVHVAALRAVALVHEDVEAAMHMWRRRPSGRQDRTCGSVRRAAGASVAPSLCDKLRPVQDAGRRRVLADDSGVLHHAFDLLVEFVAVGDDEDAGLGIVFQQPLGEQHHEDALAAALRVPDDAALALADAFLRRLHARELMRARHFLGAAVEDDEVADEVEQAGLFAHLGQRPVQQRAGASVRRCCADFHSTKNSSSVVTVP